MKKRGFTIIEVSLVLAIAGLIFVMIFVALPALQGGQRDAKRKEDIIVFLEKVKAYQNNNRGALPDFEDSSFVEQYLGDKFRDPDGNSYIVTKAETCNSNNTVCMSTPPTQMDHTLHIFKGATCSSENARPSSNPKNIAVLYRLERSGIYCADI